MNPARLRSYCYLLSYCARHRQAARQRSRRSHRL